MFSLLSPYLARPALYAPSTAPFWDDPHISKGMLDAHLDPHRNAATRAQDFLSRSVDWMAVSLPPSQFPRLLDLGCGPGLYAEALCHAGYQVTGVDLSERSIAYATASAQRQGLSVSYRTQDYLTLDEPASYDLATLIYCDFGVLSDTNRAGLLRRIYAALRPGGRLLLDVFTPLRHRDKPESTDWRFHDCGFWAEEPHLELHRFLRYDVHSAVLDQHIIVTGAQAHNYLIWDHTFTRDSLASELSQAVFSGMVWYGDVAGAPYAKNSDTLCAIATK